ncbi:MAG: uroporphyrinogen-III synthase [Bryobacteraceae bacterium]|nr:uroporphyrinogen-III synthase [Bryobacteraceae bacterium]
MSFAGRRVLALESRRAAETAELIRRNGGDPFVAPSMSEVPLEANQDAFLFAERLFAGEFDMMILLTGVGTRYLAKVLATRYPAEAFPDALRKLTIVARGPKPVAALREMGLAATIVAPEPNTWREVLAVTEGRPEKRIAVQLYGKAHPELVKALEGRGAAVATVPVYAWAMPDDTAPLVEAAKGLAAGHYDVVLITSSHQIVHLMEVARDLGIEAAAHSGLKKAIIASIGPTTSEMLHEFGFEPSMEPSHPKLGLLVKEAAEYAGSRTS